MAAMTIALGQDFAGKSSAPPKIALGFIATAIDRAELGPGSPQDLPMPFLAMPEKVDAKL